MFKKSLISVLITAAFATQGHANEAAQPFDAFISGDVGRTNSSLSGTSDNNQTDYNLRASASYQSPSNFGGQVDAVYSTNNYGNNKITNTDLAGHLFYRTDKYLLGGFLQYRSPSFTGSLADPSANAVVDVSSNLFLSEQLFWGAEGQAYFGDVTVSGQLAKQVFVNQKDISGQNIADDGYFANIKAKYFINDNWSAQGSFAYNNVNLSNNIDFGSNSIDQTIDQKSYGLNTEYRIADKPISLYAQYTHNTIDFTEANLDSDQIFAGIKVNFGSSSLKTRDRSGASLDPVLQRPTGGHIFGQNINGIGGISPI
jgi:hypothetical protein